MSTVETNLTRDDLKRINRCDEYLRTKRILKSINDFKDYEIGTAIYIKHIGTNNFVSSGGFWNTAPNKPPYKYLIIENDDGFIFAKRILGTGALGAEVKCLTTDFNSDSFELVTDEDYLDAMLLDQEYDPAAKEKEYLKKKNKTSRTNEKYRLNFDKALDAYTYLTTVKKGDILWEASTTFGDYMTKYEVEDIEVFKPDPNERSYRYYGHSSRQYGDKHESHLKEGFSIGLRVILKDVTPLDENYTYHRSNKDLMFYNICKSKCGYTHSSILIYNKKPLTPEDTI